MAEFKSNKVLINARPEKIFSFLADFNNFEKLLPEQVTNWQSTGKKCSFTIKGMADLAMYIAEKNEHSLIRYSSEGKSPFPFHMDSEFNETPDGKTETQVTINAKLNPMLKMMASRPLSNFVNILAEKLKEEMEKEG
jgi:carbon monoxide dehydrogenase subunit G